MEKQVKTVRTITWITMILVVLLLAGMVMVILQQRKTNKTLNACLIPADQQAA